MMELTIWMIDVLVSMMIGIFCIIFGYYAIRIITKWITKTINKITRSKQRKRKKKFTYFKQIRHPFHAHKTITRRSTRFTRKNTKINMASFKQNSDDDDDNDDDPHFAVPHSWSSEEQFTVFAIFMISFVLLACPLDILWNCLLFVIVISYFAISLTALMAPYHFILWTGRIIIGVDGNELNIPPITMIVSPTISTQELVSRIIDEIPDQVDQDSIYFTFNGKVVRVPDPNNDEDQDIKLTDLNIIAVKDYVKHYTIVMHGRIVGGGKHVKNNGNNDGDNDGKSTTKKSSKKKSSKNKSLDEYIKPGALLLFKFVEPDENSEIESFRLGEIKSYTATKFGFIYKFFCVT